jgi:hypothetical protein
LEIIICFTLNSADEWAGSSFQVMTEAGEVVVAMGWLLSQPWMRQDINRCNNYFNNRQGISAKIGLATHGGLRAARAREAIVKSPGRGKAAQNT